MSTLPGRGSEPTFDSPRGASTAILGKSVNVKGEIFSREDLTIDGEVEGTVELQEHRLTVGPNGKVLASVKAREIVVLGTIHGNVEASEKIDIRKEAKLVGDIKTARIVIEDGAYFKRICDGGGHGCRVRDRGLKTESCTNGARNHVHSTRHRQGDRNEGTVIPDSRRATAGEASGLELDDRYT